eukprot:scaffold1036_cov135-Skeletonema_dohrnii-CCMP3373.AAC.5
MADDNSTSEEELPLGGGGDIEQGRSTIISDENTDSVWSSEAAAITGDTTATSTATTWTPGGLEEVDVEDAAPVPLVQQIADMEMEKDDIAARGEDASTTPTVPPTQDMMLEEIEDGDDAPRPFNSAEFEDDESTPKIDLGTESADEDDGPPLPFSYERESVSDDAKKKAATPQIELSLSNGQNEAADASAAGSSADGSNESVGGDPVVQQTNEHPSPGDEENNLQRLVGPPDTNAASDYEETRQVVPLAAERYPSQPILEAYLVEEEGGRDTVYEATPIEPELPWWKQRRTKVFMTIICILMIALAAGLGAAFSRPIPIAENVPIAEIDNNKNTSTSTSNATPTAPPNSLPPTQPPTKPSYKCFADRNELKIVVDRYVRDGCGISTTLCTGISNTYGWPMREWCVDDVTNMASLFEGLDTFDEDISGWRVGQVTDMSRMFADAGIFKQDLSSWNISSVTSTREMFKGAASFNKNLCAWKDNFPYSNANDVFVDSGCTYKLDPSSTLKAPFCASACNNVTDADCFATRDELKAAVDQYVQGDWDIAGTVKYGWTIGSWCVGNVTDMSDLFKDLGEFNEDISQWEVGQVTDMRSMFWGASSFNQDLSSWNTSAVTGMRSMFYYASAFNGNISSWNTSAVTDMSYMFRKASSFNQEDLSNWDTSAVTTMRYMFNEASAFNGNIASWNTSAVTDMSYMFFGASSFNQEDLSNWDTSAVTTMYTMFSGASAFNGNISSWDTSAVTTMTWMFYGALSFNQEDLSNWDTSAVTAMRSMFNRASTFNGNISSWNTSAVTDMGSMFYGASSFNQEDLSNWDTSSVTLMRSMFDGASAFNGKIASWNTSAVTDMSFMFYGASSFNQNLCSWKDDIPYDNATDIFVGSGCTFLGKPQVEQQGPFCASSCT